jgi:hypothetical protein
MKFLVLTALARTYRRTQIILLERLRLRFDYKSKTYRKSVGDPIKLSPEVSGKILSISQHSVGLNGNRRGKSSIQLSIINLNRNVGLRLDEFDIGGDVQERRVGHCANFNRVILNKPSDVKPCGMNISTLEFSRHLTRTAKTIAGRSNLRDSLSPECLNDSEKGRGGLGFAVVDDPGSDIAVGCNGVAVEIVRRVSLGSI